MCIYKFELENAKALLAVEKDPRKRRVLQDRVAYFSQQVLRIKAHEDRRSK